MNILTFILQSLCGPIDTFVETNVTDQQPFAYTKVEYKVDDVVKDNRTSGISILPIPLCYRTVIKGENPRGFAPGVIDLSFWGDNKFTLPSSNSVYTISATNTLTLVEPIDKESAPVFELNIPAGTKKFCIIIQQNPFIGVKKDKETDPGELDITAEDLPNIDPADYTINELSEKPTVKIGFAKSKDTSFTDLLWKCAREVFKKCLESAQIDCSGSITEGLKKILCCLKLQKLRCFLAENCKKIPFCPPKPIAPICPPMPCPPAPCPPMPCPPMPCPPTPCPPVCVDIFFYMDVCVKATFLLTQICQRNGGPLYELMPAMSKPYQQYMAECDRICFPRLYQQSQTKLAVQKPASQSQKKKKTKEEESSSSEESSQKDDDKAFNTGLKVAGGVGVVVVISVCVYVGYQFMS